MEDFRAMRWCTVRSIVKYLHLQKFTQKSLGLLCGVKVRSIVKYLHFWKSAWKTLGLLGGVLSG